MNPEDQNTLLIMAIIRVLEKKGVLTEEEVEDEQVNILSEPMS